MKDESKKAPKKKIDRDNDTCRIPCPDCRGSGVICCGPHGGVCDTCNGSGRMTV